MQRWLSRCRKRRFDEAAPSFCLLAVVVLLGIGCAAARPHEPFGSLSREVINTWVKGSEQLVRVGTYPTSSVAPSVSLLTGGVKQDEFLSGFTAAPVPSVLLLSGESGSRGLGEQPPLWGLGPLLGRKVAFELLGGHQNALARSLDRIETTYDRIHFASNLWSAMRQPPLEPGATLDQRIERMRVAHDVIGGVPTLFKAADILGPSILVGTEVIQRYWLYTGRLSEHTSRTMHENLLNQAFAASPIYGAQMLPRMQVVGTREFVGPLQGYYHGSSVGQLGVGQYYFQSTLRMRHTYP